MHNASPQSEGGLLMAKHYLFGDIETRNAGLEFTMSPREFFRLGQWAIDDGPVQITTDYDTFVKVVREADYVVFHNGINYDLSVLFGADSIEPLTMAMNRRVIDTFYLAHLLTPAPQFFVGRDGRKRVLSPTASPIGHAMSWLGLDNLCHQFGLGGKLGDLKELAKKHNPPKTKVGDLDYSLIPLDDPDFLAYAEQDVVAVRDLFKYLMKQIKIQDYPGEYIWREMELLSATVGQMTRNGILVNQKYAKEKIEAAEIKKKETMQWLVETYDFPTEGKSPWASSKGKEVILRVLADYGVTPETHPEWPRTPTGALKMGGEDLIDLTKDTEAEEFAQALAELKGQRSTAQQVIDNLQPDGRVHPDITSLQASGRWSFTDPAVTVFGERTEALKDEKQLFVAAEGNVLAGFDYSNADSRAMAALSGDPEFMKRFDTDEDGNDLYDGHNLTGEVFFGSDVYYGDGPRDKKARPPLRDASKAGGHSQNYHVGAFKMAHMLNDVCRKLGLDLHFWAPKYAKSKSPLAPIERQENSIDTRDMIRAFDEGFPWLKRFKLEAVKEAETHGYVTNSWGRRMMVPKGQEWTAAPAYYGQSTTREVMGDAILNLIHRGEYYIRALRAIIHDELLTEYNEETIERDVAVTKECMEQEFNPGTDVGTPLMFPVGYGYGKDWKSAAH
jgi:DNA polymerase-1